MSSREFRERCVDCWTTQKMKKKIAKPSLVLIHSPTKPVKNGKNRRKFPSSKDCFVEFCVKSDIFEEQRLKPKISVGYEFWKYLKYENSSINGERYYVSVSHITRHSINNDLLDNFSMSKVCLHHPLNYAKYKDIQRDSFGFWFRFFGSSCRFQITIALKCANDRTIDTMELNIENIENFDATQRISIVENASKKLYVCRLYSDYEYIRVINLHIEMQSKCDWKTCITLGNEILSTLQSGKSDLKACIFLEQSKAFYHLGDFTSSKSLVKQALQTISSDSSNRNILIGRAYVYLSFCHLYDSALGNTEECLRIAREKLHYYKPCEDTGLLHFMEANLLISFLLKVPTSFGENLVLQIKKKLDLVIDHFSQSLNSTSSRIMNKIYHCKMLKAIVLLHVMFDKESEAFAENIISSKTVFSLTSDNECRFNLIKILTSCKRNFDNSDRTLLEDALNFAEKCGLFLEKQLIIKCVWKK
ncbi:uncharacterized protein LOC124447126 [Xenia sp. Carnegie-2017]|uniref:uncharacterized protein LOC124447126 n=1 Tax=Xenia sp. Carnegie-2017 TaxID=2897299 RepID=UPI001F0364D2|nr:uncharacterized protein LOC124447126 [Xenia sp. Carnegie-2017]